MNMHVPQSYEASVELQEIAAVPHQLITPRDARPIIGIVQDTLVGTYRITRPGGGSFNLREYMNLMMYNKRFDGTIPAPREGTPAAPKWTGHQVVSTLLPPLNLSMENGAHGDNPGPENKVIIQEGDVLQGTFDKGIFSKASKGIIHTTYNDYGPKDTVAMIDAFQNTIESFLVLNGFSVGISDLIADEDTKAQMEEVIQARKKEVEEILLQVHLDLFDNNTGKTNQEELESKVFGTLNKATDDSGKIGQASLAAENRMIAMVKAGSKGGPTNIAQMMACVGQQNIEGKRIPYGYLERTLPHYKKYDDGAEARGFIESSFIRGLTPQEFFFHAMSGREGLIDTACKSVTPETPIVVIEGGAPKCVQIGPWIDAQIDSAPAGTVERIQERDMELLKLQQPVYIPTADEDGAVSWGEITAITRHDPGKELYEIKTLAGKSVIVTESKSLLVYNEASKKFEHRSTPDVHPGDYVPVTHTLPEPPVILKHIAVESYLPKTKYLYGSDFIAARAAMGAAMEGREKIPAGWWDANNGAAFTLPYDSKARLQRATVRSNTENIAADCVYPFAATREHGRIPAHIPLNEENGIFFGLFLAEGNVDIPSGYVQITNNDPAIRKFARAWFEKMGVATAEEIKENKIGGTSSCIRGYSTILATLLTAMVGHGAGNKRIPAEAFTAPKEFVCGLLNGYFSGDGYVTHNSVEAGSASLELINGISMLCTRIGIFGKVAEYQIEHNNVGTEHIQPTHRISIRAQWATIFANTVHLIDATKQAKLAAIQPTEFHRNFATQNDVVLDKIVEITRVDVAKYPKVYDLTVPSTLNFGLANGLHVVDTAETGYIQRKLIKAMEDLVIQHDGTVRDANMNIVQFTYGEDGTNATKLESVPLPLGKLTEADVESKYGLADVDFTAVFAEGVDRGADVDPLKEFVAAVKEDRRMVVEGIFASGRQGNVNSPVNLERMINNLAIRFGFTAESKTDLTPAYLLDGIKRILAKTQPNNRLWAAILRFYLAPHSLIVKQRFTKAAFETLAEMIVVKNWQSWAHPGELVGILAAQSIGEPSTQMCSVKSTQIVVTDGESLYYSGPIGKFIDMLLETTPDEVITIGEDHVILDLAKPYYIVGVSDDEKVSWKRISQVSRHPANGGLVKVTTKSGRTTTATLTHSFLKRVAKGIVPVLGSDLAVGDRVPIARSIPEAPGALTTMAHGSTTFALDYDFGWLCGIYLADGSFSGNTVKICKINPVVEERISALCSRYGWEYDVKHYSGAYGPAKDTNIKSKDLKQFLLTNFGTGSYEKTVGGFVYHSTTKFIAGLIAGYFDGDGNVNVERQQIRAGSRCKGLIRHMNRLLSYCGIFGVVSEEKSVRMPGKVMYTLNVLKKYAAAYKAAIGFNLPEKAAALDQIITYMERDEKHDTKEIYDKIPALGPIIAETGRLLKMPGQSRNYGRWLKKESVGRMTLAQYVSDFKDMMAVHCDDTVKETVLANIATLESALAADVVWDEIIDLTYLDDPMEHVYDFTVPGNDSFMVDDSILVHNTLNTFHLAGVAAKSNVTRGVPRLNELLKVTKEPKATALTAYLKPEYRESKEKAREVAQDLALTVLREITKKVGIYYDPNDEMTVVEEDRDLMEFYRIFENAQLTDKMEQKHSNFMLRIELDRDAMFNKNITMNDVAFVLRNKYPALHLVYSDYNSNRLVMRVRITITTPEMDDLENFKKLQNTLLNSVVIRGVPGIKAVNFRKDVEKVEQVDGEYKQVTQYVLDTDGSNFLEVMNHPSVDGNRIYSTNVHDIYNQLGVEAARAVLLSEITVLFEEAGLNFRHLGLLCDVMTCSGRLISTDRYGINKTDAGPIGKASFEQTATILQNAAVFGEVDPITSVSANIMTGQTIRGGTAFSQILLDEQALPRLLEGLPALEGIEEEGDMEGDVEQMLEEAADDVCGRARFQMNMAIPARATEIDDEDEVELQII